MANIETLLADTRYFVDQGSDPAAPSAGNRVLYTKAGGIYLRSSAGILGPLLDEAAHDALDHTGLTGVGGGTGAFAGVWAQKTASFPTLTTSIDTTLVFDGTDVYDTDAFHDPGSNPSRITIPAGFNGKYGKFWGLGSFAAHATGFRRFCLAKNGTLIICATLAAVTASSATQLAVHFPPIVLATGDYFELTAFQDSGGNLAMVAQAFGLEIA